MGGGLTGRRGECCRRRPSWRYCSPAAPWSGPISQTPDGQAQPGLAAIRRIPDRRRARRERAVVAHLRRSGARPADRARLRAEPAPAGGGRAGAAGARAARGRDRRAVSAAAAGRGLAAARARERAQPGAPVGDASLLEYTNDSLGVQAAWEIDLWGKFRRSVESADATLAASVANYDDVLVSLTADLATAYLQLRTLQQQRAVATRQRQGAGGGAADRHRPLSRRHHRRARRRAGEDHPGLDQGQRSRSSSSRSSRPGTRSRR